MSAARSPRACIRGMLGDLKMPESLEAVDELLSARVADVGGGRFTAARAQLPKVDRQPRGEGR